MNLISRQVLALTIVLWGTVTFADEPTEPVAVDVRVDARVELFSIIFRLAGNPEYRRGSIESYTKAVDEHFGAHRNHEVVKIAQRLRAERGVSYDAPMSLAVHLGNAEQLRLAVPREPRPETLDSRWRLKDVDAFLAAARSFAADSDFAGFLAGQAALHRLAVARLQKTLEDADLGWFDRFFGRRPGADFTVIVGLLNGGQCYGPRVRRASGDEDLYCVLGVWSVDGDGQPSFGADVQPLVVHEFCHSYVNPLVYAHQKELEPSGTLIYPFVQQAMQRQAYGNWTTMLHESVVRACVVHYTRDTRGADAAARETVEQIGLQFLWVPELVTQLDLYTQNRKQHRDFAAFFPRIIAFFDEYAPRFARERKALARGTPKVEKLTPASGATDVDPSLTAITIRFDRTMRDGSWSVVGGGERFPEVTAPPSYDSTRRVLTLPVRLKAGWSYEFWLNSDKHKGFQSDKSVPMEPLHVTFTTASGR